ncbi:hypothetical protein VMCG_07286 [Cytospora schulzeri]|uniref:Uncharacterized protein n=1 Tax=Cytospora schulzeri TaxID=448051 RepID=A0A423WAH4_9PEZI|nr:hypothetical protein VMCG_07286 [Valsa malicola]
MYSSPADILAALNEYRSYIAAESRRALDIFVPFITNAQEPEEGDFEDDFDVEKQRMEVLKQLIGYDTVLDNDGITAPAELLERYDDLAPRLGLDGTFIIDADDERSRKQDEYFSAIEEALKLKCIEEVRGMIAIPEEFRSLAEHVDGLHGPGLEYWRSKFQYAAWWGLIEDCEMYSRRVKTPDELTQWLSMTDMGWTIGGGWELGEGPDAILFAVYCRRPEDDGWGWRYVLSREYGEELFETIPEVLVWNAHFREHDLSKIPEFGEDDMWCLMF